jgi:nucleoside-diphosphate-sugar epimerase
MRKTELARRLGIPKANVDRFSDLRHHMAYHRTYGMPTNIPRIFNTYGPRMKLDDDRVVPSSTSASHQM